MISRRRLVTAGLALGSAAMAGQALAQGAGKAYPTRPVHWIVGFAPGSVPDIAARLMGQRLSERLGQPFVIENRTGAGGRRPRVSNHGRTRGAPRPHPSRRVAARRSSG